MTREVINLLWHVIFKIVNSLDDQGHSYKSIQWFKHFMGIKMKSTVDKKLCMYMAFALCLLVGRMDINLYFQ